MPVGALSFLDDAERQAVLDGAEGIERLDLDVKIYVGGRQPVDLHDRSVSNRFKDILKLARHAFAPAATVAQGAAYIRAPCMEMRSKPQSSITPKTHRPTRPQKAADATESKIKSGRHASASRLTLHRHWTARAWLQAVLRRWHRRSDRSMRTHQDRRRGGFREPVQSGQRSRRDGRDLMGRDAPFLRSITGHSAKRAKPHQVAC